MVLVKLDESAIVASNNDMVLRKLFKHSSPEGYVILITTDGYYVVTREDVILTIKE